MQFPNMEDEDGDFGANSMTRSRLSSLFQTERASGDVNQALTFTAPKQPKKNDNTQSNKEKMKLILAATVHAYKLVDGNYTKIGKLGFAILGVHENSIYSLLLYKDKQTVISTINITSSFKFHVQPNNYATFYDEKNENWSVNFDTESALINFAKQIAVLKYNTQDRSQASLVVQDLAQGAGSSLDVGDGADVKYTGWLLSNYTFGEIFDSNMQSESTFRFRPGKKVIKGWSEGLIGVQKGTNRLLVVPPSLAYGAEGMGKTVPPNSTLIFEISVVKVKLLRDSSHSSSPLKVSENVPEKKPDVLPRHSISSEDNIRLRGASISEQLSQSPKKDKAQLISRMAKMGTATLPFQGAIPAQVSSESENEEDIALEKSSPVPQSGSRTASPKPISRPSSRKNSGQGISTQNIQLQSVQETSQLVSQPASPFYTQTMIPNQQSYGIAPTNAFPVFQPQITSQYQMPQTQYAVHGVAGMVPPVATSIADTHLPMLITETRSQNTEVRMSLSKITDKVDTVIQKIDDLRLNQGRSGTLSHSSFMDSAMLVQSIEKIVQENSQLKEDSEAKSSKIQSLNEKICDLLQRNQGFFEESNSMLEQRSDSLQAVSAESHAKLFSLEKDKAKLSSELTDTMSRLVSLESKIENHLSQEIELKKILEEKEKQLKILDLELLNLRKKSDSDSETASMLNALGSEIKDLYIEKNDLLAKLKNWEEKYEDLNKSFTETTKELQILQEQVHKSNSQSALSESRKSETLLQEKIKSLQVELQSALPWKEKYEVFYQKTKQLKENYESQIQKLMVELKQMQSSVSSSQSSDFSGEIRRVMNALYKLLQGKFEPQATYIGDQVLKMSLEAIRFLTLKMLQKEDQKVGSTTKESLPATTKEATTLNPATRTSGLKPTENDLLEGGGDRIKALTTADNNGASVALGDEVSSIVEGHASLLTSDQEQPADVFSSNHSQAGGERQSSSVISNDVQSADSELVENSLAITSVSKTSLQNIDPGVDENSSVSSSISTTPSKAVSQTRDSPNHTQQLSSTNISGHSISETSSPKIWKPQPPPDDDDDDDSDDWLK